MPDALQAALNTEGLGWLLLAVLAAGLVRGFAGFGSAMITMPVASTVLDPFGAIAFLVVLELVGPLPNLAAAVRSGHRGNVLLLLCGALAALPVGLWALSRLSADDFGWIVSTVVLAMLVLLLAGWRYSRPLGQGMIALVGALGGFLSGVSGLAGPPVIMLYMSSRLPADVIRANFLLYLFGIDVMMTAAFWLMDRLDPGAVVLGLVLMLPYLGANMLGARLFRPEAEQQFRAVAYLVIAASAIFGLPIWT